MRMLITFLFVLLLGSEATAQYSSKFLKNRQEQRQIAKAIEKAQSRERTRQAIKKVGCRPVVIRTRRK